MKIKYLTEYEENKTKFKRVERKPVKPCTLEEIELLEEKINNGNPLPQALREYLFIGGHGTGLPITYNYDNMIHGADRIKEELAKRGVIIDRPIVIIRNFEGRFFTFIYLDEGDNPKPWNCSISDAYDRDDGEIIWESPFSTFKDCIDKMAYRAVRGWGL